MPRVSAKCWFSVSGIMAAIILIAGFGLYWYFVPLHSLATQSSVNWVKYVSHNAGIAFDYPQGWVVTDQTVTGPYSKSDAKLITYNILYTCPSVRQRVVTNAGAANCISFFLKNEIINAGPGFEDNAALFAEFTKYIGNPLYMNFRTMRESNHPHNEPASDVNLIGLYIDNQGSPVGIYQLLCSQGESSECLVLFHHVLESIHALPKT